MRWHICLQCIECMAQQSDVALDRGRDVQTSLGPWRAEQHCKDIVHRNSKERVLKCWKCQKLMHERRRAGHRDKRHDRLKQRTHPNARTGRAVSCLLLALCSRTPCMLCLALMLVKLDLVTRLGRRDATSRRDAMQRTRSPGHSTLGIRMRVLPRRKTKYVRNHFMSTPTNLGSSVHAQIEHKVPDRKPCAFALKRRALLYRHNRKQCFHNTERCTEPCIHVLACAMRLSERHSHSTEQSMTFRTNNSGSHVR